jgi:RNA polymerase sigma-70 factor, ECF subfamily
MDPSNLVTEKADDLVRRARAGDMDAFTTLFESFREMVRRIAWRLVGESEAEDVVMETYLKAWQAVPNFRGGAALKTWLYRIAYNVSVDFLRRRARQTRHFVSEADLGSDHPLEIADERQAGADEVMESAETALIVRQALEKLPAEHRATLLMRFADDMSYAEIAAATGVSIGTVMSRLFYGKRKLKVVLKDSKSERGA